MVCLPVGLEKSGSQQHNEIFFDTLLVTPKDPVEEVKARAESKQINLRYYPNGHVCVMSLHYMYNTMCEIYHSNVISGFLFAHETLSLYIVSHTLCNIHPA